jgi:adenylate cyclase
MNHCLELTFGKSPIMMRLLIFLLLAMPFFSFAQSAPYKAFVINSDSLDDRNSSTLEIENGWKFHQGDVKEFADPYFDDGNWQYIKADVRIDSEIARTSGYFSRIDCYRRHIIVDSAVVGRPLSLTVTGFGAFEIYIDGKLVKKYGRIAKGEENRFYYPKNDPYIFAFRSAGPHLLAVRYANYAYNSAIKNSSFNSVTGFNFVIGDANRVVKGNFSSMVENSRLLIFFFSLFLTLSVVHMLLFLYYRPIVSNLYFSMFALSLSFWFLMFFNGNVNPDPATQAMYSTWLSPIALVVLYFSFSGINNELFSRKKLRLKIIGACCLLAFIINMFSDVVGGVVFAVLGVGVLIEGLILPVVGMYRKIVGARIVGSGVLLFAIFLSTTLIYAIINGGLSFSSGSLAGLLFNIIAGCAILSIPFSMSVYLSSRFATINKDLKRQLKNVEDLSAKAIVQEQEKKKILEGQKENLEQQVSARTAEVMAQKEEIERQHDDLKTEKKKSDDLLLNILPEEIAEELKQTGHSEARYFSQVTVMFTDFVDFTKAGETMTPAELVNELNTCFMAFDDIMSKYNIEKIKTIGDAYLAVSGLPLPHPRHAEDVVSASFEILRFMADRRARLGSKTFETRIGVNSGPVAAGIIGVKKFAYDIWGDTVNTAARMEQNSLPGKINITQSVYDLVKDKFDCTFRGEITAKNKGPLNMYFVDGPRKVI